MTGVWKDIPGYEGFYQVSNEGYVRSLDRTIYCTRGNIEYSYDVEGVVLTPSKDSYGYAIVSLSKNGSSKKKKVHRLVGEAFIENPENLPLINHKDENTMNNEATNLEWCTPMYNNVYGNRIKKIVEKNSIKVKGTNIETGEVIFFESAREAGRSGFSPGNITNCCLGKLSRHKGYKWESERRRVGYENT